MFNNRSKLGWTWLIVLPLSLLGMFQAANGTEVQKAGTTSLQTLKISSSVRAIGMAETYCAVADDIQAMFWNPAGLIHVEGKSAYFSQINMPAGISFNTAAVAVNMGRRGVWGVHMLAMTTDDMKVRTIFKPEGTGEQFMAYDIIGGVSYAQRLTDRFIFGFNLRLAVSGLGDSDFTGGLADIGTLYETNLNTLKIGMSVQNFGPDVEYSGNYFDYLDQGRRARNDAQESDFSHAPPPTIYRLGLSADLFEFTGLKRPYNWDGILAVEMSHPNDNRERINVGVEMTYLEVFSLRTGYKIRYKNVLGYDEERWTAGFGLKIPVQGSIGVNLDYAFMDFGRIYEATDTFMDKPHRMSLSINF